MSDSVSLLETIDGSQAAHEVTANALFDAGSVATAYGRHAEACAGLTWGYYGARYGGTAVANGTNACGASTTTYMVAHLTTGAISFATATTNWNTAATYGRCFKLVTGASTITNYEDHRFGPLGVFTASAVAGSGDMILASVQTVTGAKTFGSAGAVGKLIVAGTTSGTTILDATAVASGTLTLPAATDTLVGKATTDTFTNKSIAGSQLTGAYTAAGLTLATARLLGRTTASTGAAEEISIGSGLSMSAGSLSATGSGGTVTTVSVTTANGVSGSVATETTTPAITLTLGAITPTTIVASSTIAGSNLSGTNTGDQSLAAYATSAYVDAALAGLSWKQAVRAATTANGTLASAYENGDTIDGVVLATGDRILLKNQTAGAENGIYLVAASGAPTRTTDANSSAELVNASVYVSEGTTLADTQWTCSTNAPITVDTTALVFAQLSSGGGGSTQGKHSFYIPASALRPRISNGCQGLQPTELTSTRPNLVPLYFDGTVAEYAQTPNGIVMPKSWNLGTLSYKVHWNHLATTVNFGTAWELAAVAIRDGDANDTAYGTAITVTDTGGTTSTFYSTAESAALTVGGTIAAECKVSFQVNRAPGNASDNMATDAGLDGITVYYTTNADTDA